jgi:hypothetical protein
MTFARFNPCNPCCSEVVGCGCVKYKMRSALNYVDLLLFGSYDQNVLNFYAKDVVDGSTCWRDNPETTRLIWFEEDGIQYIESKEYTEEYNGFICWWNQPTDTYPRVPVLDLSDHELINCYMKFALDSSITSCDEYFCGELLVGVSDFTEVTITTPIYNGANIPPDHGRIINFYDAGYNTGDIIDPEFPKYYDYATVKCNDPESCCLEEDVLYLIQTYDSNIIGFDIPLVTLTKVDNKWVGTDGDFRFELLTCHTNPTTLTLRIYCGTSLLYNKISGYPYGRGCLVDTLCFGCNDPLRGIIFYVDGLADSPCLDYTTGAAFYHLSKYPDKIVECNCETPIAKNLYVSFSNITSPCNLSEELITEISAFKPFYYEWSNSGNPLIVDGTKYEFVLTSTYGWFKVSLPDNSGSVYSLLQYWTLGVAISGFNFDWCFPPGSFCSCINYDQENLLSASPTPGPNCDPFQLVYNVHLQKTNELDTECPSCTDFTVTITE